MNLLIGLVLGGLLLAAVEGRHIGIAATIASNPPPPPPMPPELGGGYPQIGVGGSIVDSLGAPAIGIGVQGGEMIGESLADAGSNLAKSIPIIGSVVGAIAGSLLAAHERRKAQATSENSAVNAFIPAMDKAVVQIVTAYNGGHMSGRQAAAFFEQLWQMYWAEVTPHIQPGRNGCRGGAAVPRSKGGTVENSSCGTGSGSSHIANKYKCGSDWGAACCVGGAAIEGTVANLKWAALTVDAGARGNQVSVRACQIGDGSGRVNKYGGMSRPGYTVVFQKP